MSPTVHDDLESQLRELFDRQAQAMSLNARAWDDPPMATVSALVRTRRPRSAVAAVLATAAAVALVVGIVAVAPERGVHVAGQPGAPVAVHFATPQVRFDAAALAIDADGQRFTSAGSTVDVNSDPGTRDKYTTLELTWTERGVEMRLYAYFASDGHDWWATELRTYNGKSNGDWIFYTNTYFRTPLGHAFTGNVDLSPTDGTGHLHISNLRLQAFLPPIACEHPTTRYALEVPYARADMPKGAGGFGLGITTLLDTATCTPVADPHAFSFDWQIADPAVAKIETAADKPLLTQLLGVDPTQSMNLAPTGHGSTTLHLTARERTTGKVVATADVAVTVG
jgi:hypothetical protein